MDFPIDEVIFEASALQVPNVKASVKEVSVMKDRDILGKHKKGGELRNVSQPLRRGAPSTCLILESLTNSQSKTH